MLNEQEIYLNRHVANKMNTLYFFITQILCMFLIINLTYYFDNNCITSSLISYIFIMMYIMIISCYTKFAVITRINVNGYIIICLLEYIGIFVLTCWGCKIIFSDITCVNILLIYIPLAIYVTLNVFIMTVIVAVLLLSRL